MATGKIDFGSLLMKIQRQSDKQNVHHSRTHKGLEKFNNSAFLNEAISPRFVPRSHWYLTTDWWWSACLKSLVPLAGVLQKLPPSWHFRCWGNQHQFCGPIPPWATSLLHMKQKALSPHTSAAVDGNAKLSSSLQWRGNCCSWQTQWVERRNGDFSGWKC